MPTATITVEYVNQPKPGKKMGSIKGSDGQYYGVWPNDLNQFRQGETVTIEYSAISL